MFPRRSKRSPILPKNQPKRTLHPWRFSWNIIMEGWKIIFLSKWVICRFHVNLPGCKYISCKHSQMKWNLETISVVGSQWIQLDTTFLTSENPEQWRNPPMQNEMFICYDKGKTGENTTQMIYVCVSLLTLPQILLGKVLVNIPSKCFACRWGFWNIHQEASRNTGHWIFNKKSGDCRVTDHPKLVCTLEYSMTRWWQLK